MALQEFSIASLATMDDGRVAATLADEMRRAVKDCLDRPNETKPRRVALVFEIKPGYVDETGDCEEVKIVHAFRNNYLARKSREYSMLPKRNGALLFNDLSPGNARQMTIDALDHDETGDDEAGNHIQDVKEPK